MLESLLKKISVRADSLMWRVPPSEIRSASRGESQLESFSESLYGTLMYCRSAPEGALSLSVLFLAKS